MSHIFISYSTRNATYANKLADKLRNEGFDVWIDNTKLRSSEDWWRSIVLAIWDCAAFIVILSPESDKSKWVQREITLADQRNKPTFPMLLDGDINTPNWAIFVRTQFIDVRGGKLPEDSFYQKLEQHAARKKDHGNDITDQIRAVDMGDGSLLQAMENPPPPDETTSATPPMSMTQKQSSGLPPMLMIGVIAILIVVIGVLAFQLANSQPDASASIDENSLESDVMENDDLEESVSVELGLPGGDPILQNWQWEPQYADFADYVLVPMGCFVMGEDKAISETDAAPATDICFDEPFWIRAHEVRFEEWGNCVSFGACEEITSYIEAQENDELALPVNRVTWHQASAYCDWDSLSGRLPTEAEWEYAARGPDSFPYPWGGEFVDYAIVWAENYGEVLPAIDDELRHDGKSWVAAWDMIGNVAEWTASEYRDYPYDPDDGREFPGDDDPILVVRGGGYFYNAEELTATHRDTAHAYDAEDHIGFRCVSPYSG